MPRNPAPPAKPPRSGMPTRPRACGIVGLGASAGGLEPLEQFFSRIEPGSGLAYVVVQHLDPQRASVLADLLASKTRIPVSQAEDGLDVSPNHAYVIPPNALLTLEQRKLRVKRPLAAGLRNAIDAFLTSLAMEAGEAAVGILFSGTGNDGTVGMRAVKENGGLTLAQAPETAKCDGMPESAMSAGLVDLVCTAEEMPRILIERGVDSHRISPEAGRDLDREIEHCRDRICAALQERTGHDFQRYKSGTLLRRVKRRILLSRTDSAGEYVRLLTESGEEAGLLLKDLLIGVTEFFRDPEAFAIIAERVLPRLLEGNPAGLALRLWVPGCSSGEEAYSLAMLVRELLDDREDARPVQIFATDIDSEMLARARQGRYSGEIAQQVAPKRLMRFFVPDCSKGSGRTATYQASRELREMCVFSEHNIIRDPPFSSLDLVSCRNLLIYLDTELQKRIVPLFHYALRPGGHLFLGPSEGPAAYSELFKIVDKKCRIFERKECAIRPSLDFPLARRSMAPPPSAIATTATAPRVTQPLVSQAFERMLLDRHVPPCAVVNEAGDILSTAGRLTRILPPPAGTPPLNVLDQAQGQLRVELHTALIKAAKLRRMVTRDMIVTLDDRVVHLRLTIEPLPGVSQDSGLYAVIFHEAAPAPDPENGAAASALEEPLLHHLDDAILGRTVAELGREPGGENLDALIHQVLATGKPHRLEHRSVEGRFWDVQFIPELREDEVVSVLSIARDITERRQAEEALRQSEEHFRRLFETMLQGVVYQDAHGTITSMNPAAERILGKTRAEFLGETSESVEHHTIREDGSIFPGLEHPSMVALRTGKEVRDVVMGVFNPKENARRWIRITAVPLFAPGESTPGQVYTVFDDITEILASRAKMETALESMTDAVILSDAEGRFVELNTAAATFHKFPNKAACAKTLAEYPEFLDVFLPDGTLAPLDQWAVARALRGETRTNEEYSLRRKDTGESWTASFSFAPIRNAEGIITGSVVAGRDITEAKRTEEELRRSKAETQTLLENTPAGLVLFEGKRPYKVLAHNRHYQELFAEPFRSRGVVGLNVFEYAPAVEAEGIVALFDEVVRTQQPKSLLDFPYKSNPPDQSWFNWHLSPVILDGEVMALVSMTLDVTERHVAQEELKGANLRLAEADQRKNEFLAMLSHELRNPLAPVRNSLHILNHAEPRSEQARRAKAVIDRQVGHMVRLVDDLLDVTRIGRGKIQLRRQPLELTELLRRTCEDHRSEFAKTEVELEICLGDRPLWVHGDTARLAQTVGNLLQNAAKFTGKGGHVRLSLELEENAAKRVAVIRVCDTGVGISADVLPRLFQPFTQADASLDRSKGGLGLGLAIVKGMMELHDGSVEAHSEGPGKGSEFVLRLPLQREATAGDSAPGEPQARSGGTRVLIIEDNADAADSLRDVLELNGHLVEVAYSGQDALEKARKVNPQVVLCDIGLPGMDGYAIARAFRSEPGLRSALLVALSGYALAEDIAKAEKAGFSAHLAKPPSLDKLEQLISEECRRDSPSTAPEPLAESANEQRVP